MVVTVADASGRATYADIRGAAGYSARVVTATSSTDALVTIDYAVCRNVPIQGIVFNRYDANDPMERDNVETVMTLSPVKRFATIPSFTTYLCTA